MFKNVIDTLLVGASFSWGGEAITFHMRHFNVISFIDFDDNTLMRIFKTITAWHFSSHPFKQDVRELSTAIVKATLEGYRTSVKKLLPTPMKSHYTFNLRDFSRVVQGVLRVKPAEHVDGSYVTRLWFHEMMRVFSDRLINSEDQDSFIHFERAPEEVHEEQAWQIFSSRRRSIRLSLALLWQLYESGPEAYEEVTDITTLTEKMEGYPEEEIICRSSRCHLSCFCLQSSTYREYRG